MMTKLYGIAIKDLGNVSEVYSYPKVYKGITIARDKLDDRSDCKDYSTAGHEVWIYGFPLDTLTPEQKGLVDKVVKDIESLAPTIFAGANGTGGYISFSSFVSNDRGEIEFPLSDTDDYYDDDEEDEEEDWDNENYDSKDFDPIRRLEGIYGNSHPGKEVLDKLEVLCGTHVTVLPSSSYHKKYHNKIAYVMRMPCDKFYLHEAHCQDVSKLARWELPCQDSPVFKVEAIEGVHFEWISDSAIFNYYGHAMPRITQ